MPSLRLSPPRDIEIINTPRLSSRGVLLFHPLESAREPPRSLLARHLRQTRRERCKRKRLAWRIRRGWDLQPPVCWEAHRVCNGRRPGTTTSGAIYLARRSPRALNARGTQLFGFGVACRKDAWGVRNSSLASVVKARRHQSHRSLSPGLLSCLVSHAIWMRTRKLFGRSQFLGCTRRIRMLSLSS